MSNRAPILGRTRGQVDESDAISTHDVRVRATAAEHGSAALKARLDWQFEKEAKRLRITFEDARLLCVNSVRL